MTYVLLIVALAIILGSAELFTNGVEWLGRRYNMGEGAVGSVLAAVGTAMPETLVPLIAIVFVGGVSSDEVGIGAILGAPFMLSTLAMFVTATAILVFTATKRRTRKVTINEPVMTRDLSHFLISYVIAISVGLITTVTTVPEWARIVVAIGLIGFYAYYVFETMRSEGDLGEECKPLYLHRHPVMPARHRIFLQIAIALAGIIIGADIFVREVQIVSESLGISALILSLLITPIATELPEKFNSVIWIRQRKDTLALGNITGAMVFQATFPVSIGMLFTEWKLDQVGIVSGALAILSGVILYITLRTKHSLHWESLMACGALYIIYLVYVFGWMV